MYKDSQRHDMPWVKDLLAEFWRLEKGAESLLKGLAE